jgi:hypothetical protein
MSQSVRVRGNIEELEGFCTVFGGEFTYVFISEYAVIDDWIGAQLDLSFVSLR